MKKCPKCNIIKNLDAFAKDRTRKSGKQPYCRDCQAKLKHEHYIKNKDKINKDSMSWAKRNPDKAKSYRFKYKYGIDLNFFNSLKEQQKDRCLFCLEIKPLVVDHCHRTGKVRGLLCRDCNTVLGFLKENTNTFKRALKYLESHGEINEYHNSKTNFAISD